MIRQIGCIRAILPYITVGRRCTAFNRINKMNKIIQFLIFLHLNFFSKFSTILQMVHISLTRLVWILVDPINVGWDTSITIQAGSARITIPRKNTEQGIVMGQWATCIIVTSWKLIIKWIKHVSLYLRFHNFVRNCCTTSTADSSRTHHIWLNSSRHCAIAIFIADQWNGDRIQILLSLRYFTGPAIASQSSILSIWHRSVGCWQANRTYIYSNCDWLFPEQDLDIIGEEWRVVSFLPHVAVQLSCLHVRLVLQWI